MEQTLHYRELTPDDALAWRALRLEGIRDFPLGFLMTVDEARTADIERCRKTLATGAFRGVLMGSALIGFCGFHRSPLARIRHRAEIGPFFVAARYHGSGAADALMDGLIAEAGALGLAQLELFVDTDNHRAIAFYRRHGFKLVATHPDNVRIDGQPRDDHFYRLRLPR